MRGQAGCKKQKNEEVTLRASEWNREEWGGNHNKGEGHE